MKRLLPQKLKILYEFIPSDPAEKEKARQGMDGAFDILFDAVFKAELNALKLCKAPGQRQNKRVSSTREYTILDNSERLDTMKV